MTLTRIARTGRNRPGPAPPNGRCDMTADTHQTAPTQFVEANGIRFANRRFGKAGAA
jgi:hypothetical protein